MNATETTMADVLADAFTTLAPIFGAALRRGALGINVDVTRVGQNSIGIVIVMRGTSAEAREQARLLKMDAAWAGISLKGDAAEFDEEMRDAMPSHTPRDGQLINLIYSPSSKAV